MSFLIINNDIIQTLGNNEIKFRTVCLVLEAHIYMFEFEGLKLESRGKHQYAASKFHVRTKERLGFYC